LMVMGDTGRLTCGNVFGIVGVGWATVRITATVMPQ
jgi:hypothetical protein